MNSKLIISILFLTLASAVFSDFSFQTSNRYTGWNDTSGGNIFYLDRHNVNCASNEAMRNWNLERQNRNSDKIRIRSNCVKSEAIKSHNVRHTSTAFNGTWWWSKKCLHFLDRHNVNCSKFGGNWVLKQWKLGRSGNNINISYTCVESEVIQCKSFSTPLNDLGGKQLWYLDRHNVGSGDTNAWVIRSWKMWTSGNRIYFTGDKCRLRDLPAKRDMEAKLRLYNNAQESLRQAKEELTNTKKEAETNNQEYDEAKQNLAAAENKVNKLEEDLKQAANITQEAQQALQRAQEAHNNSVQQSHQLNQNLQLREQNLEATKLAKAQGETAIQNAMDNLNKETEVLIQIQNSLSAAKQEYIEALDKISELENLVQVQQKLKDDYDETIENNKISVENHKEEKTEIEESITSTTEKVAEHKRTIIEAETKVTEDKAKLVSANNNVEALRKQLEEAEKLAHDAENNVQISEENHEDEKNSLAQTEEQLAKYQKSKENQELRIEEAETKLSNNQSTLEGIVSQIFKLEEEGRSAEETKGSIAENIKQINGLVTEQEMVIMQAQQALFQANDLQSQNAQKLESVKSLRSGLQGHLANAQSELQEDKDDVAEAKKAVQDAEKYYADTNAEYLKVQASFENYQNIFNTLDARLLELFRSQKALVDSVEKLDKERENKMISYQLAVRKGGF